jgi:ribosomal protein S18 acetylase RimI-like enzyme
MEAQPMNATVAIPPGSKLRRGTIRDCDAIMATARAAGWPSWIQDDLPRLLHSRYTRCWLLEGNGRLAGFALASVRYVSGLPLGLRRALVCVWRKLTWQRRAKALVDVFDVALAPGQDCPGAEQLLLDRLHKALCADACYLRIVVPEASLPAQLFLRQAGYQAVRLLHGYYGDQDGYLMVRPSEQVSAHSLEQHWPEQLGACST